MKRVISGLMILIIVFASAPGFAETSSENVAEAIGDTLAGAIIGGIANVIIASIASPYAPEPFSFFDALKDGIAVGGVLGFLLGVNSAAPAQSE